MDLTFKGIGPTAFIVLGLMTLPRMAMPQAAENVILGGTALNSGSGEIQRVRVAPEEPEADPTAPQQMTEAEAMQDIAEELMRQAQTGGAETGIDPVVQEMLQQFETVVEGLEAAPPGEGPSGPAAMERALMQALDGGRPPAAGRRCP